MDKIIYCVINLRCDHQKAFEMFTVNRHLEKWLTVVADVEPKIGGRYELYWNPQDRKNDSTIGCKILAFHPNCLILFEWKGPKQYKHLMNEVRPLTNVVVFITPSSQGTEVHLLHTGWKNTPEWEEARLWFEKAWDIAFKRLGKYVNIGETDPG